MIGKNHFGSVHFPTAGGWVPRTLHNYVLRTRPMGSYNALVDLMGHRHLGGKTVLYMLDGLYTAVHNEGNVFRWQSFGDQWASSMLMSQDPVALDSVGMDILSHEPRATELRGNADNYLHEAAQAAKPPSGTVYNPDKSGALASLGVHEHWNNAGRPEVLAQPGPQARHRTDRQGLAASVPMRITACADARRDQQAPSPKSANVPGSGTSDGASSLMKKLSMPKQATALSAVNQNALMLSNSGPKKICVAGKPQFSGGSSCE